MLPQRRLANFASAAIYAALAFTFTLAQAATAKTEPHAGAQTEPESSKPKRGRTPIEITHLQTTTVELPDGGTYPFGNDFEARLTTELTQGGQFLVVSQPLPPSGLEPFSLNSSVNSSGSSQRPDPIVWAGSVSPAATVRISLNALAVRTGARGTQMFYGFDSENKLSIIGNEFRLKDDSTSSLDPSWFEGEFDPIGNSVTGSQVGLSLSEHFSFGFSGYAVESTYKRYQANMVLHIEMIDAENNVIANEFFNSDTNGFYVEIGGSYQGYSAAIRLARKDVILRAWTEMIAKTFTHLGKTLGQLPRFALIDGVTENAEYGKVYLLGTGWKSEIPTGTVFESPTARLEVVESLESGSIARVVRGVGGLSTDPRVISNNNREPEIPIGTLFKESIDVSANSLNETENAIKEAAKENPIITAITLPYQIWRYLKTDQKFHKKADFSSKFSVLHSARKFAEWQTGQDWARQIALPELGTEARTARETRVAVIDTGVDYNHPVIHHNIQKDEAGNPVGYDFTSGDSRAYDDAYHGTAVASLILAINPSAKIIPIKAFNPWGITSSQTLANAIDFAIEHQAELIICAWATSINSKALHVALARATALGIKVVASAGDSNTNIDFQKKYPAQLAMSDESILTVSAHDRNGYRFRTADRGAAFGERTVQIAAPSVQIPVALPRGNWGNLDRSFLATAIVAGVWSLTPQMPRSLFLDRFSVTEPKLDGQVQNSRKLHF